jgi:drug/metabolite transporter (DMT)-like permease
MADDASGGRVKVPYRWCVAVLDRMADWLHQSLGARGQLRFGIVTVLGSVAWTAGALLFTDEPPNVIAMSGVALILTGVTIIVAAEVLERRE